LVVCAFLVWWVYSAHQRTQQKVMQAECMGNVKHLCLALLTYADDHGGHLPPAARWVELTKPYMPRDRSYTCPAAPKVEVGYGYADYLAGLDRAKMPYASEILMVWDGSPTSPSPDPRHNYGAIVGYADGHAKWMGFGLAFRRGTDLDRALVEGKLPPPPGPTGKPPSAPPTQGR